MTKNKSVRRATAVAKEAIQNAKNEMVDTATDIKESVVDTTEKVTKTTDSVCEPGTKYTCCKMKKDTRNWLIVIAIVAVIFFGYRYIAKNNVPSVQNLFGGLIVGEEVDANDERQWGYAVGTIVGQQVVQMMAQAPGREEMDMDMFVRGLNDTVRESPKSLLSEEQVQKLLEKRMQIEQEKLIVKARENKELSDAFVVEYAQREGVQALEGGTLYTAQTTGAGAYVGERTAQVHYTGKHLNGEEFDSSRRDGAEEPVVLSAKMVVPGFGAALSAMRVGDVWEVVIPAEQAYGEQGMPPAGIDPNEALIFEIEIVSLDA